MYYRDALPENIYVENYLKKIVSENNLTSALEFGCGSGYWLEYLAKIGLTIIKGVDFSDGMLEKAKNRCSQYHNVQIEKQFIPEGFKTDSKYQLLISNYFISSLLEEVDLLNLMFIMNNILDNENGKVIIVENKMPEEDILQNLESRLLELTEVWGGQALRTKYKLYSQSKLESLFDSAGFSVEEKRDVNSDIFMYLLKRKEK